MLDRTIKFYLIYIICPAALFKQLKIQANSKPVRFFKIPAQPRPFSDQARGPWAGPAHDEQGCRCASKTLTKEFISKSQLLIERVQKQTDDLQSKVNDTCVVTKLVEGIIISEMQKLAKSLR